MIRLYESNGKPWEASHSDDGILTDRQIAKGKPHNATHLVCERWRDPDTGRDSFYRFWVQADTATDIREWFPAPRFTIEETPT